MSDQPASGRFEGKTHLFPIRVYYEDTDFSGFVYHGTFVKFFERGRSEALRLVGLQHSDLLKLAPPAAMVVRSMTVTFLKPAVIDDALLVRSTFRQARGARMLIAQEIWRGDEVLATADIEAALINLGGGPRRFPPSIAAKLEPWITAP